MGGLGERGGQEERGEKLREGGKGREETEYRGRRVGDRKGPSERGRG